MAKLALITKHLVLTEFQDRSLSYPVPGVVLIEGEKIEKVIIVSPDESESGLIAKYSDWNPVDYSDFYISPGLIDLNCLVEWESLEQLTKESVKGGFTCIVVEPSHHGLANTSGKLYCDVMNVQIINDFTNFSSIPNDISVLKTYLYPPSTNVKSVANLEHVLKSGLKTGLPVFVDPSLPDPRMLYMASPHRLESIDQRGKTEDGSGSTVFAAAFPQLSHTDSDLDDSESGDLDTEDFRIMKTFSLQHNEICNFSNVKKSVSSERLLEMFSCEDFFEKVEESSFKILEKVVRHSHDIYHDLDVRVKEQEQNIEDLCKAEKFTYSASGPTNFDLPEVPKKSASLPAFTNSQPSPSKEVEERPVRKRRPTPIQIKVQPKIDISKDYNFYLANCPDHWETLGIEKILEFLPESSSLHFFNLSSATAINRVRNAKKKFPKITCEVSSNTLYFNSSQIPPGDTRFKISPPIRNQGNCNLLWEMLKMKCIDCISSGHSAIDPTYKLTGNFSQTLNGIPSAGLPLNCIWTRLNQPTSSGEQLEHYIVRLAKWFSLHPAKVLGIDSKTGKIEEGLRADLVIWNPYKKSVLSDSVYKRTSPYIGEEITGSVEKVYLKGVVVYEAGVKIEPEGSIINQ